MLQRPLGAALALALSFAALLRAADYRVHVFEADAGPIAGAAVELLGEAQPASGTTDDAGWCTLALPDAERTSVRVRVSADGYFHSDARHPAGNYADVALVRSRALSGRVIDAETRAPIASARVEFTHPWCRDCAPDVAVSDAEGRYSFASVPRTERASFVASSASHARQPFAVGLDGEPREHVFELANGVVISGVVVSAETREPLPGARVAKRGPGASETKCDERGRFALRVLPDPATGRANLEASHEGYCKLRFDVRYADAGRALELPLYAPAFIEGRATSSSGAPLAGARVAVREANNWLGSVRAELDVGERAPYDELAPGWFVTSGHPNHEVVADRDGRFRTLGVVPWSPSILIEIEHAETGRFARDVGPVGAPNSAIEVTVAPPIAVPGGRVRGTLRVNGEIVLGRIAWQGATRAGAIVLDAQGVFDASDVELDEVELTPRDLRSPLMGFGSLFDGERAVVTVGATGIAQHVFVLTCETTSVRGRMLTQRGAPCAGVPVGASDVLVHTRGNAVSTNEGTFDIRVPKTAGPWRVTALRDSEIATRDGVRADERVEFVFADLRRALVSFVDAQTRAAIAPASLSWRRKGDAKFALRDLGIGAAQDTSGWLPLELPAGDIELLAWTPQRNYVPATLRALAVELTGDAPRLEFEFAQGFGVDVELAPDSAAPIRAESERAWLLEARPEFFGEAASPWNRENVALPTFADRTRRVIFDARGRARVAGLAPGVHRFVSYAPGVRIEPAEVEIRAAEQRVVVRVVRD